MIHPSTDQVSPEPYAQTRISAVSEFLLGLAAVTVLAMLLVPAWLDHRVRERVSQCLDLVQPVQTQIDAHHRMLGDWPQKLRIQPIAPYLVGEYCEGFTGYDPTSGAFMVNINESAFHSELPRLQPQLTPVPDETGGLRWTCSRGSTSPMQLKYLPSECRGLQRG